MAVRVASLEAVLEINKRQFESGLRSVDKSIDSVDRSLNEVTYQIDETANALGKMGKEGKRGLDGIEAGADNAGGGIASFGNELLGMAGFATIGFGAVVAGITAVVAGLVDLDREFSSSMRKLQAQTGATGEELEALGDTALEVFSDNFGESVTDAVSAVSQVSRVLGETGDALEASTKNALLFRDVFDVDINESVRGVRSAVAAFGIDSATVFDMMAKVIQNVGDPAQDLADTVNEYSVIFADAGFSAEEMFGILQEGVRQGARNFDVVADAVKEFTIRIQDGSDTTKTALERMFEAVGEGNTEFRELERQLANVDSALAENERALSESEGAYEAQQKVVDDLKDALDEAERQLDKLASPNLRGMQEFDDQIFSLEQQAKRAELALLDLEPDSDAYERTAEKIDDLNTQIDKLELQRDLIFDEQLREINRIATEGREPIYTYEEALAAVTGQRKRVEDLSAAFYEQSEALDPLAQQVTNLESANADLIAQQDELTAALENATSPAQDFLDALESGSMSGRDAMSEVIQRLKQIDNEVLRNQIGVALFGTKWEDLGDQVILSLDPAQVALQDFGGTTDAVADAMNSGITPAVDSFVDKLKVGAIRAIQDFKAEVGPTFERMGEALDRINEALGLAPGTIDAVTIALEPLVFLLERVADWLEVGAGWAHVWASGIEAVAGAAEGAKGKLPSLADIGESVQQAWADWRPGSPPPLAEGIAAVGDAISGLESKTQVMRAPASTTSNVTNLNMGSLGNFSFQGAGAQDDALRMVLQMLRQQLEAA